MTEVPKNNDFEIRRCSRIEVSSMVEVINRAAFKYRGVIPDDRWHEPYMPLSELEHEIAAGVDFIGAFENEQLVGVMGSQAVKGATLIRHAYVDPKWQGLGIGSQLINRHLDASRLPVFVGTWAAAHWATSFYLRHGFVTCAQLLTERLLKQFWSIPDRQIETSVVLTKPALTEDDLVRLGIK